MSRLRCWRSAWPLVITVVPAAALAADPPTPQSVSYAGATATFEDSRLAIGNDRIMRTFDWNGGRLISLLIEDRQTGHVWQLGGEFPDVVLPGLDGPADDATLAIRKAAASPIVPAHLAVEVTTRFGELQVRRTCRVFEDTPAIGCDLYVRGHSPANWIQSPAAEDSRAMIENDSATASEDGPVVDRLQLPGKHWSVSYVQFNAATDHNDTLVHVGTTRLFRKDQRVPGNLLLLENTLNRQQLFVLREAPAGPDQLYYRGYDFVVGYGNVRVSGVGVSAADISHDGWTRGYGTVVGVAGNGELALLDALRAHQETSRILEPGRDHMILMNTWGDRSRDGRMNDAFAIRELEAGHRLGITHLQLDDGWQAGLSANSASDSGELWDEWHADAWRPNPSRFPNGLDPVLGKARDLDIQLGLWFNPSSADSYAGWAQDADILIDLYRRYGIRVFKIDGIEIPDKTAETNLRHLFDKVVAASDGQVVFNLDVTAGTRPGYHHFVEYGNIFLENRYTDWANYYPYRSLRNLWMLSRFVPPQRLQIEFLNTLRNADKYATDDPLAPARVPFDYAFAVTMMAQPLAWFEGTGLPDHAFDIAPLVRGYRDVQTDLHAGRVFPIGEQPDGTAWTGFQSIRGREGYVLVYREFNNRPNAGVTTWLADGETAEFQVVLGEGDDFDAEVGKGGVVEFSLPRPHSFALYRYRLR